MKPKSHVPQLLLALLATSLAHAQTKAPGGVSTNLFLWLKADTLVTTLASPASKVTYVTGWKNLASTAMAANPHAGGSKDIVCSKTGDLLNYNPTVYFTGTKNDDLPGKYTSPPTAAPLIFTVSTAETSSDNTSDTYSQDGSGGVGEHGGIYYDNSTGTYSPDATGTTKGTPTTGFKGIPVIVRAQYASNSDVLNSVTAANGTPSASCVSSSSLASTGSGDFEIGGRTLGGSSTQIFTGQIAEVIHYDGSSAITSSQVNQIESYLAIKYGITLSTNYLNTAADTIYPATTTAYNNNIIGIGRDDNTYLNQKQSHQLDDSTRIYLSTRQTNNSSNGGSFSSDKQFLVMGNNGGLLKNNNSTEFPASGVSARIGREWQVVNTDFTGTFSMDITLNSLCTVNPNDFVLLVDDNDNFANATIYTAAAGLSFSNSGNTITISGITTAMIPQNSTRYITLATSKVSGGTFTTTNQQVCSGSAPASNIVFNSSGQTISKWQYSSVSNFATDVHDTAVTSATLIGSSIGKPAATRYYRAVIQNTLCYTVYSAVDTITVIPGSIGGSAYPWIATACSGSSVVLTLSDYRGAIQWQQSTTGIWWSNVSGGSGANSATYITPPLTGSLFYQAVVKNGICNSATSLNMYVNVLPQVSLLDFGAISTTTPTICSGSSAVINSGLTIPPVDFEFQWQSNASGFFVDIPGATTSSYTTPGLTSSASYQLTAVGIDGCATSVAQTVTVNAPSVSGTISTTSSICTGSTATLNLNGYSGSIQWQANASGSFANIPGATSASYTTPALAANTSYQAVVTNGVCSSTTSLPVLIDVNTNVWTGATSAAWNLPSNWQCNYVPLSATDVVIPSGVTNYPILNTTAAGLIHNITIQNGASLIIASDTLKISGTISNSGTLDATKGSVELQGSTPQVIDGSMFAGHTINNLIVNNAAVNVASTAGDTLNIASVLSFGNINNATLNTGGNISLLSDCSNVNSGITAMVADLTNGGANSGNTIVGSVTAQRCIPARRAWVLLTAPVSGTQSIFSAWQNGGVYTPGLGTNITMPNPGSSGLDAAINNSYSMLAFNSATQLFAPVVNTYAGISGNTGSADNKGYMIFVRGDRNPNNIMNPMWSPPLTVTNLCSYGKLQTYAQSFPVNPLPGKYMVVGNPYAAPVDFNKLVLNHVTRRFYAWDASLNQVGGFVVFDDIANTGVYTSPVTNTTQTQILQSGQAVFVMTDSVGGNGSSITFNESSKADGTNNLIFRPAATMPSLHVVLYLLDSGNVTTCADGAIAQFDNSFSAGVDWQDASKLNNVNEGISFYRDSQSLAIERRPMITGNDTLYIRMTGTTARNYRLLLSPANLSQSGLSASLIDNYLNTRTPFDLVNSSIVDYAVTNDAASTGNRFMIAFKQSTPVPVTFIAVIATQQDNSATINWKVSNEANVASYAIERSTDGTNFSKVGTVPATGSNNYQWSDATAPAGNVYYKIQSIDNSGNTAYSNTVNVTALNSVKSITLPDNNYTDNAFSFVFTNMPEGKYTARLYANNGQLLEEKQIDYAGGTSNVPVDFGAAPVKGLNIVEIICSDKTSYSFKVKMW